MRHCDFVNTVAGAVKRARISAGLSRAGFARRARVSRATVIRLEDGTYSPRGSTLVKVARALGVPVATLLGIPEPKRR